MARILILARHGKAQKRSAQRIDFSRELTKAGARSLKALYPRMLRAVDMAQGRTIEVWSSPAQRCMQTAQIMADILTEQGFRIIGEVRAVDSLGDKDAETFLDEVAECPSDVVVAVGHNPFVGDLTRQLTGAQLEFATGSIASIRLRNQLGDDSVRLQWYLQGPESKRWKTLCQLDKTFNHAARTVEERLEAFDVDPEDPETTHQLRISIRTLRSLLAFAEPYLKKSACKRLQRDLRAVVLQFSRLRELDVFAKQLQGLSNCDPVLTEACSQMRREECERVVARMGKKDMRKAVARVRKALRKGAWRESVEAEGLSYDEVRSAFDLMVANTSAHVSELDVTDAEQTHHVRKECKRVRYVAENLVGVLGEDAPGIAKQMEAGQDYLGELCDARVNMGIIGEFEKLELPEEAERNLADLRAHNEAVVNTALRHATQEEGPLA